VLAYPGAGILRVDFAVDSITFSAAPEPGIWTMMLLGLGGAGATLRARRRASGPVAAA
jgi:hypothetical protein